MKHWMRLQLNETKKVHVDAAVDEANCNITHMYSRAGKLMKASVCIRCVAVMFSTLCLCVSIHKMGFAHTT